MQIKIPTDRHPVTLLQLQYFLRFDKNSYAFLKTLFLIENTLVEDSWENIIRITGRETSIIIYKPFFYSMLMAKTIEHMFLKRVIFSRFLVKLCVVKCVY